MIRISASRILNSGVFGRRQLSTKGFQNWLLTTNAEEQKLEEIKLPQTGLSKATERAGSSFKTGSSGSAAQKTTSSASSSQLVKVDNLKPESLDNPYTKSYTLPKPESKPLPLPPANQEKPKIHNKPQIKSKKDSKDQKKKSKDEKPPGSDEKKSNEQMCSHHTTMVPPSDVLEQLKTFELQSKCTAFHMKSSGHDR